MKKPAFRIPQVLLRLDGADYITSLYADEFTAVGRLGAIRRALKNLKPVSGLFLFVLVGGANITWILADFDWPGFEPSPVWKVVMALAIGPIALLLFNTIVADRELDLAGKKRSQLLYRFPRPVSSYSSGLMEKAHEVASIAKTVGKKVEPGIGKAEAPREQVDAVTHQLHLLVDLLADTRGPAGHNPLAEQAHLLGDAVPEHAAHLVKECEQWQESHREWLEEYCIAMESLRTSISVLDFAIRLAESNPDRK